MGYATIGQMVDESPIHMPPAQIHVHEVARAKY